MYSFVRITDAARRDRARDAVRQPAAHPRRRRVLRRLRRSLSPAPAGRAARRAWGMRARIGLIYGATDATMVAQNMVVAAETLGYGTCYIGAVQNAHRRHRPGVGAAAGRAAALRAVHRRHRRGKNSRRSSRAFRAISASFENSYPVDFTAAELESAYTAMSVKRDWYAEHWRLLCRRRHDGTSRAGNGTCAPAAGARPSSQCRQDHALRRAHAGLHDGRPQPDALPRTNSASAVGRRKRAWLRDLHARYAPSVAAGAATQRGAHPHCELQAAPRRGGDAPALAAAQICARCAAYCHHPAGPDRTRGQTAASNTPRSAPQRSWS
jgi:hypothetical protein